MSDTSFTDYIDTFKDLRMNLEEEGRDLEWTIIHLRNDGILSCQTETERTLDYDVGINLRRFIDQDNISEFLLEQVPYRLSQQSMIFKLFFFEKLQNSNNPIDSNQLEQLIMINYQISIIRLHQQLWQTYIDSGTGQIVKYYPENASSVYTKSIHYWPIYLLSMTVARGFTRKIQYDNLNHQTQVAIIKQYLSYLQVRSNEYVEQLNRMKTDLINYTDELNHQILQFIRQEVLIPVNLYFESLIILIQHDYNDRLMQLHFHQSKSNQSQMQLIQRISSLTFIKEKTEQEYNLFHDNVHRKKLPAFCALFGAFLPNILTGLRNSNDRVRLKQQYIQVIERTRFDLLAIMTAAASLIKEHHRDQLNLFLIETWKQQHSSPSDQQMTLTMLKIIESKQKNIQQCLRYIYKNKIDFFIHIPIVIFRHFPRTILN